MALFEIGENRADAMPRSDGPVASAVITAGHGSGPDNSPEALAALIREPGFDTAMFAIARSSVEEHRASWLMNRILSDRGQLIAAYMALDFYFADPSRRGFTIVQLHDAAARLGFASPGRVRAWATSLLLLGFFAVASPGRPQRLMLTAKFFAVMRRRMAFAYQSIAAFHPVPGFTSAALDRDAFLGAIVAGWLVHYRQGQRSMAPAPELSDIADREAGVVMLLSVLLKDHAGAPIVIADLAREFFVSRAHVRTIMQEASALGLVVRSDGDRRYRALPLLGDAMRRFFAALFQLHIYALEQALAADAGIASTAMYGAR